MMASLERVATRRVTRSGTVRKPKKTLEDVKQGIRTLYSPENAEVDIVFVPGLGADPVASWKSNNNDFNWSSHKEGLQKDFPKARILLYQNESAWIGALKVKQYIHNLSTTLLHGLRSVRDKYSRRPIVFIGHSMGGLVIAKAVVIADSRRDLFPSMFEAVTGCIFFGTPFDGAPSAALASLWAVVGENIDQTIPSKLLDLMKPGNESLRELKNDFVRLVGKLSQKIELFCFWEQHETDYTKLIDLPSWVKTVIKPLIPKNIKQVVSSESATLDGVDPMGLACIHRDLVKFDSFQDERYQLVRSPLKRIINGAQVVVKNRFNSTRNIDHKTITEVMDALEGGSVSRKRKDLGTVYAASSWLTKEKEYGDWLSMARNDDASPIENKSQRGECLWIRGPRGRGKTNNMIAAVDGIENMIRETPTGQAPVLIAYFFCEPNPDFCTAEDLLKSLLWQLIKQQGMLAPYAKHFVKKKGKDESSKTSPQLTVENMWQVLQEMLADEFIGRGVYFLINNLHALPEKADATVKLMGLLKSEVETPSTEEQKRVPVRWLFTSRKNDGIFEALKSESVSIIDLENEKYEDQVHQGLRKHATTKVSALREEKKYNSAVTYFASSLIGGRAQNTQWIDLACVHLNELPQNESELRVRQTLEAMPQDLKMFLEQAWLQIFNNNPQDVEKIKEMLRALVLTFEDPTESELSVLTGLDTKDELVDKAIDVDIPKKLEKADGEVRQLADKCKPLLVVTKRAAEKGTTEKEIKICFMNAVVKEHLLDNAAKLLGLSKDAIERNHGVLALRSFSHLMEGLAFPEPEEITEISEDHITHEDSSSHKEEEEEGNFFGGLFGDEDNNGEQNSEDDSDSDSEDSSDSDEDSDSEYNDWDEEESECGCTSCQKRSSIKDAEAKKVNEAALPYMVKHWLHHASRATMIADVISLEVEFWQQKSRVRRRWLLRYADLTGAFENFQDPDLDGDLTALHVAASVGFTELVAALIKNGHQEEVYLRDVLFNSPLHFAAYFGRENIVDKLLEKDAPIDDCIDLGYDTPLHMAASSGKDRVMEKLIRSKANINARSDDNGPVVNSAILSGNREAVKILVDHGASFTVEIKDDDDFDGPLATAALYSDLSMVEYLVETCGGGLPPEEFNRALVAAAGGGRADVFSKLLECHDYSHEILQEALEAAVAEENWDVSTVLLNRCQGLDCEELFSNAVFTVENQDDLLESIWRYTKCTISDETLASCLNFAAGHGKQPTVELLLDRFGAKPNSTHDDSGTPLTQASYFGNIDLVKTLLAKGADAGSPDGWALQTAAAEGHENVVQELLRCGAKAKVNAYTTIENFPGGTALQAASKAGHTKIVELLLQHKADPNVFADPDTTPLLVATEEGENDIVKLLIHAGADVNACGGSDSSTPLVNAAAFLPKDTLELLLAKGAKIDLPSNENGDTALIAAAARGDEECVQLLLDQGADIMHSNKLGRNALQEAFESYSMDCLKMLIDRVSKILGTLETARDSGSTDSAKVIGSVNGSPLKPLDSQSANSNGHARRGSEVSFVAHDEQMHYHVRDLHRALRDDDDFSDDDTPADAAKFEEGLSPISSSSFDPYSEQSRQHSDAHGISRTPQDPESNAEHSQPEQQILGQNECDYPSPSPSPSPLKIRRKPSPVVLIPGKYSDTPITGFPEVSRPSNNPEVLPPTPPKLNTTPLPRKLSPYGELTPYDPESKIGYTARHDSKPSSPYPGYQVESYQGTYNPRPQSQQAAKYPSPPPEQVVPQQQRTTQYASAAPERRVPPQLQPSYRPQPYQTNSSKEQRYHDPIYQQSIPQTTGKIQPQSGYRAGNSHERENYDSEIWNAVPTPEPRRSFFNVKFPGRGN